LVLGGVIWRHVANGLGITAAATVPALAVVVLVPGVLLLLNAIAFVPARAVARVRPAAGLRAE
jgi:hypothetical protein